uniref:BPTI/Kunitz inhibitor domain-containing protein n=1 Tax=Poecilia reticulata TaxID=8081 RepID=A0A3P9PIP4_POERE
NAASSVIFIYCINVCVLLAACCQLDVDFGSQCTVSVQRWFFDRTVAACAPFWFGGCGGNANRFSSERECFRTCGVQSKSRHRPALGRVSPLRRDRLQEGIRCRSSSSLRADACLQRQDPGGCQDYAMMWFFDTVQNECARFWYGGCDGNANRFETQEECENLSLTLSSKSLRTRTNLLLPGNNRIFLVNSWFWF